MMKKKNENLTAHQRIFKKYNRVPLGFDPSVARLLGHDPTPRPTCPAHDDERT